MRRREFVSILVAATCLRTARAQQGYLRFVPYLIDLPGWTAPDPAGEDKERNGDHFTTIARSYTRGDAHLYVSLTSFTGSPTGFPTAGTLLARGRTSTIDGFQTRIYLTPSLVSIAVTLAPRATLNFLFNGVFEDEAIAISRQFDWTRVQALLD